jgi:hypothetical protein
MCRVGPGNDRTLQSRFDCDALSVDTKLGSHMMSRVVASVLRSAALLVAGLACVAVAVEIFSVLVRPISLSVHLGNRRKRGTD